MGRGVLRHQRPGRHRLTQDNRTARSAREGTGKRRYTLFFVADFSPLMAATSPADRQHMRQAFPPASYAPGNTPNTQKRHRKPQKPRQTLMEYRDTDPQRKTAPVAVKAAKKRDRPPPAPTRARAFIPRPVVFSSVKHHLKERLPLQVSALPNQTVRASAAQTSHQQDTTAQAIQAKRAAKEGRGERSHPARHVQPGTTDSGGGSRQTSGQRQAVSGRKMAFCKKILQAWRHVVVITSVIVTMWRMDDGQTCTAAAPSQRGGGWFAIPQAEMWATPWVTLPPTSMFHFQCSKPQFQPRLWNQVPRWTQVTRKIAGRGVV